MAATQERKTKASPPKTIDRDSIPARIATGVGDLKIPFPSKAYFGDATGFSFDGCKKLHRQLTDILTRNNVHLRIVGAEADGSFVAVLGDIDHPILLWENYVQDGRSEHTLYFDKMSMPLLPFLEKPENEQDILLRPIILQAWVLPD